MTTTTTATHDAVHHPSHYTSHPSGFECLEVTRQLFFSAGNAVKYVWRRNDKGTTVQDLKKALFYLNDVHTHDPAARNVPDEAAMILHAVGVAENDPVAAEFFHAAAEMRWREAELAVGILLDQLESEPLR